MDGGDGTDSLHGGWVMTSYTVAIETTAIPLSPLAPPLPTRRILHTLDFTAEVEPTI
jgi:hypothetical protein